jgi:hypothetical protein
MTKRTPRTWRKPVTERCPPARELDRTRVRDQARLPPHRRGGRHQRSTGSSARARSQARGGVPRGTAASSLHRWGSLCARRTLARAGQASPRAHQHQLQRRQPKHAPASEPKARRRRDTTTGHARSINARGAKPAPRGAGAHRASGRIAGRKLGIPHLPTGERTGRRGRARPRSVSTHGRRGGAAERPANPGRTPVRERILGTRGQAQDGDARNVINARRTGNTKTRAAAGYHPRRGGRYDSRETARRRRSPREPACSAGRSAQ